MKRTEKKSRGGNTYLRMVVRGMKSSASRILAIFGIVALGVGFLFGLISTTPDMHNSVDAFYDSTNMMDLRILSTLGFTDADLDAIRSADDVLDVAGGYNTDTILSDGSSSYVTLVHSIPESGTWINAAELKSGRLPQAEGECVVETGSSILTTSFEPGTVLTVVDADADGALKVNELTVVGMVGSSRYFSVERETSTKGNGQVGMIVYTTESTFNSDVYTSVYVRSSSALPMNCFEDEYTDTVAKLTESIKSSAGFRLEERYNEVYSAYDSAIQNGIEKLNAGKSQLESAKQLLTSKREQLDALNAVISSMPEDGTYEGMTKKELERSASELSAAIELIANGISSGEKEIADGEAKLAEAVETRDSLEKTVWYYYDRSDNLGYSSFAGNAEKIGAIAKIFPVFFFLVALLVSLTTMTRMVDEERMMIGTMKALGYGNGAICFKYIFYAGTAGILGSAVGLAVGSRVFPTVIYNVYSMMYSLPPLKLLFNIGTALISSLAIILSTVLATFLSCRISLSEKPAELLRPKAPKMGKRIFLEHIKPVWRRMKFTHKVTARNILLYKKRFFMTVIGIAGCTALLLTGFGLRDSIGGIVELQYEDIFKYNLMVVRYNDDYDSDFEKLLADNGVTESINVMMQKQSVSSNDEKDYDAYCIVPSDTSAATAFIDLRNPDTGEHYAFGSEDVYVTEKLSQLLGISEGDTVSITDENGKKYEFTVSGIAENYLNSYVYVGTEAYRNATGSYPECRVVLAKADGSTKEIRDKTTTALLENKNTLSASFTDGLSESFNNMLNKINYIVYVLIVSAGALAFIVLYNLININIAERTREIATLKVLGFFDREVYSYVFRETGVLTVIGAVVGLVGGIFLHSFVVKTAEMENIMFSHTIHFPSYLLAFVMTAGFSTLVALIMTRKLRRIDMVESLKSNE